MGSGRDPQLCGAVPCGTFTAGSERWRLYVFGVSRPGRDWLIDLAVVGPRTCTVSVRARMGTSCAVTAERVVDAVRGWLMSGNADEHAMLDLPGTVVQAV